MPPLMIFIMRKIRKIAPRHYFSCHDAICRHAPYAPYSAFMILLLPPPHYAICLFRLYADICYILPILLRCRAIIFAAGAMALLFTVITLFSILQPLLMIFKTPLLLLLLLHTTHLTIIAAAAVIPSDYYYYL